MTTPVLAPVTFYPPLVNPSPYGLYPAVSWTDDEIPRWLDGGVQFRPINYGGDVSADNNPVGIWSANWCTGEIGSGSVSDRIKWGQRPELPDPFAAYTLWAYDECDPTPESRAEVLERVQQIFRLAEPIVSEYVFGALLVDAVNAAGIAVSRDTVREGVSYLEGQLAKTGTLGLIHASAEAASRQDGVVFPQGTILRTILGHTAVFGGGYVDTLGDLLVATSPVYGWRDTATVRPALDPLNNTYAAVAERSVVIGYEKLIGAVYANVEGS